MGQMLTWGFTAVENMGLVNLAPASPQMAKAPAIMAPEAYNIEV